MTGSLDRSNVQGEVVSLSLEHLLRSNVTAADDPSNAATRHLLLEEAIKAAETASFAESKSIHTSYYAGHAYVARLWDSGRRFSPRRFQSMVDKASSALMRVITVSKLSLPDDIDEKIEKNEVLADERELLRMRQQSYATLVRLHITGFFYFASKNRSKKARRCSQAA